MRCAVLALLAFAWASADTSCFPIFEIGEEVSSEQVGPETTLSIAVAKPHVDREVAMGAVVEIEWTAVNLTGSEAVATILVRARDSRADAETILAGGLRLPEAGGDRSLEWDTSGFQGGAYSVVGRIEAGGRTEESSAAGKITINTPPAFDFTEPKEDTALEEDPNAADGTATVTIGWTAFDPDGDGKAELSVDPDRDHESGDETVILERDIPQSAGPESFEWDGTDKDGARVEKGAYYLYAVISDEINGEQPIVEGLARVIVPEEPNQVTLAITEPTEDTTFLTTDPNELLIEFTLDEDDDVLVDLEVDPDENHQNGNEIAILSQRLIETGTNESSFEWDGTDVDDKDVAVGIYRILLVVNRGSGSPDIAASGGWVFRRSEEKQPLITLLEPDEDQTVEAGAFVLIKWRDDDPSESATIRLWLDDDQTLDEIVESGEAAQREILPEPRDASGDGVQDTFQYRVPDDLDFGRYYIIARIDRNDAAPFDDTSIAAGQIVLEEPGEGG